MRTLIIDDEEYVRLVLEQALREEGCEVTAVTHGAAGIEALQTTTFECVITDLRMPGLDGRAVLKWVREHQPDVDVLMLTGHGDVKDAVEAIKQGALDFLVKVTQTCAELPSSRLIAAKRPSGERETRPRIFLLHEESTALAVPSRAIHTSSRDCVRATPAA